MKVVGLGVVCLDYLAFVDIFPVADSKIKTTESHTFGGGNIGNTFTALSRLNFECIVLSKVGSDINAKTILQGLESDGVDTSLVVSGMNIIHHILILLLINRLLHVHVLILLCLKKLHQQKY